MLHEILLSLSGQPSPLLDPELETNGTSSGPFPLLSPPEKALLETLSRLSRLHAQLRAHTARISSSHRSTVCRAVSSAISIEHLGRFQKQILDVERAVLGNDSNYVGGYGIVPLSTLVSEFAPWARRLEWLWGVACFILPESDAKDAAAREACSGASLIDYLRAESQTGYVDLQGIALHLTKAAETAWMRQLSMWLLYGELPTFGKDDFFVQTTEVEPEDDEFSPSKATVDYMIQVDLLPKFVSMPTASSILFIGKSLNHIRSRRNRSTVDNATGSITGIILEPEHLRHLSSLESPISTSLLANAVTAIRLSVSQTSLSKLLPLPKIVEILSLIHDFLLLGRGEFVTSLVSHADSRLQARITRPGATTSGDLGEVIIKEGEVSAALAQTWTELYALQSEEAPADEQLDLARELLTLNLQPSSKKGEQVMIPQNNAASNITTKISSVSFADLLFPTETALSLKIQPPIDLFLSASDMSVYSIMHSYLLGIRRAQIRLSNLWKHTTMRRIHPSPLGPPRSNTRGGQHHLQTQRQRQTIRTIQMRQIWATASASLFILSEIGGYLQGEVIQESWQHFQAWLERGPNCSVAASSRPGSQHETAMAALRGPAQRKQTASAPLEQQQQQHDPESITVAHRRYLSSLAQSLFLTDVPFTSSLRSFLSSLDHIIALVSRLETVQRNLDLEADEGVVDALADYGKEEGALWGDLRDAHAAVQTSIKDIISRLRDIDDNRSVDDSHRRMFEVTDSGTGPSRGSMENDRNMYIPRKAAGVDQLLMKLDFAGLSDNSVFVDDGAGEREDDY